MKKILLIISLVLLFSVSIVSAHEHNFDETKQLINSGISCEKLTDEQLEAIGDYYMEQMHSGEAHELMDKMMRGEGSESLKEMHIQMAKALYCGESSGMMPMMMNMMSGNVMGGQTSMQTNMMQGMMGNWGYGFGYWNYLNVLYALLLFGLIILVYFSIIKLWRYPSKKKR